MDEVVKKIMAISGKNPFLCYQCGLCSSVCPVADYMDVPPHRIVRMIQLGGEELEKVESVWRCVACMTCVDRCPRNVGPGVIFEAVRLLTLRRGVDKVTLEEVKDIDKVPVLAVVAVARKMAG